MDEVTRAEKKLLCAKALKVTKKREVYKAQNALKRLLRPKLKEAA